MPDFQRTILTHGGAGSNPKDFDGTDSAASRGINLMANGGTALAAVVDEVYTWLENSMNPGDAAHKAITLFDLCVDIGLIILTRNGFASNARNGMPWSHMTENKHQ
ncbi:MAG: hypothetical protein K9K63_13650 [Desulfotignum sp.]|nr:hypothetical protein [Desulfotignum sp.]MCF8138344.1 hypothetical protein [Desulfotignum sp.]